MTKTILTIASALLLLAACGKKEAPQAEKATDNYLKRQPGDSTLYGLACDGTTDSLLVLLPYTGADPDTSTSSMPVSRNRYSANRLSVTNWL